MRSAVVILNWNTKEYLRDFLPPLLRSLSEEDLPVVADSASTDGSLAMMAEEFPGVKTIALDANYGYTGGYNRALAQLDAEYFVLINSDILVEDGWLEPLLAWMDSHPDCGICGPKLRGLLKSGEGGGADSSVAGYRKSEFFEYAGAAGGYLDRWAFPFCRGRVLSRVCKDDGRYDSASEVLWCSGACLVVRSSVWKELGGLDDRFFAHMEEIDLCWRAQLAGWKVWAVPQSTVWHLGGGTLTAKSPWKLELNYRNNLLLLGNNLAATYRVAGDSPRMAGLKAALKIAFRLLLDDISLLIYLLEGKASYAKAVIRAHSGWRKLRSGKAGVAGAKALPKGLIPINIIPHALLRGEGIFDFLDKKFIGI